MAKKSTSLAKVEANRRNAQKSTGPKDTSLTRLNALKHGILSKEILVQGEDEDELRELGRRLRLELGPQGELECILVDRIVSSVWRLRRALKVEKEAMDLHYASEMESDYNLHYVSKEQTQRLAHQNMLAGDHTEKIQKYETTIERQIYKALHELQRLQGSRSGERPPLPVAVDLDISSDS